MKQERTCVITKQTLDTNSLLRFVASPDGVLTPDVWRKLPGRGVWVTASKELLDEPDTTKTLIRRASSQLKQKLTLLAKGEELTSLIEGQLKQQALNRLGLMRSSGQVITGFEKVASAIKSGKIKTWVEAEDAKSDGASKLEGLSRGLDNKTPVVDVFERDELSKALGGENVVHVALLDNKQAARFVTDALRLLQFQGKSIRHVGGLK